MSKIIVADAGPLIAFGRIKQLQLLTKLFEKIIIPEVIAGECLVKKNLPGANAIQQEISNKAIQIYSDPTVAELKDLTDILDIGEAAAIKLAYQYKFPLLIDEKLGRSIAKKLDIKVIGSAGILLLAKQRKIIPVVKPVLSQLKKENYYFADHLVEEILHRAGEKELLEV